MSFTREGKAMAQRMQHYFNSLHVYCRLREMGFAEERAKVYAVMWEKYVHPVVYYNAD